MSDATNLAVLTRGLEKLESLSISSSQAHDFGVWVPEHRINVEQIGAYLTALVNASSLRSLNLDLKFLWDTEFYQNNGPAIAAGAVIPEPPTTLGSAVKFQALKNLTSLKLSHVAITLQELEQLIERLPKDVELQFDCVLLTTGSWAEALDVLRKKASDSSWITRPMGQEFFNMSKEKKSELLSARGTFRNNALVAFLTGRKKQNPLRETPSSA